MNVGKLKELLASIPDETPVDVFVAQSGISKISHMEYVLPMHNAEDSPFLRIHGKDRPHPREILTAGLNLGQSRPKIDNPPAVETPTQPQEPAPAPPPRSMKKPSPAPKEQSMVKSRAVKMLRRAVKKKGATLFAISSSIGYSDAQLKNWLRGKYRIPLNKTNEIAGYLQMNPRRFFEAVQEQHRDFPSPTEKKMGVPLPMKPWESSEIDHILAKLEGL